MKTNKDNGEDYNKPFPTRLRALLDDENGISPLGKPVTQTELAQAFHDNGMPVTRQTISLYANGTTKPDFEKFKFTADYFKVSYDYLLGESDSTQREHIDIAEKTGLSDNAIETLEQIKGVTEVDDIARAFYAKLAQKIINYLLGNSKKLRELTDTIYEYLDYLATTKVELEGFEKNMRTTATYSPKYNEWALSERLKEIGQWLAEIIKKDKDYNEFSYKYDCYIEDYENECTEELSEYNREVE